VGVSVALAEHTVKGYPPRVHRGSGGVREEEPWELTRGRRPFDRQPPIAACPRHAEAVDEAR
jgi:hypothetical protein